MVDLTVTGGGDTVRDFTPSAFKYDSSSFYNYEQDNLPIWDLEDRTQFNYFKLGASLSALSGVTYTLSSASVTSANVFSDIQDIVDRLPKVVNFPVIIEIAKYGDLGDLNLQGIKFEGNGAILVKNLVYAKALSEGVPAVAALGTWADGNTRDLVTQVSSSDWTDQLTNAQTSNPNFSAVSVHSDSDLSANYRFIGERRKDLSFLNVSVPDRLNLDIESSNFTRSTNLYGLSGYTNERDLSISSSDIDIYWQNGYDTTRNLELDTTWFVQFLQNVQNVNGFLFGNYFTSVKVADCGGNERSVILSGIMVDSGAEYADPSSLEHVTDHGFYIQDSQVNIADCFAIRCKESGFKAINSYVNVVKAMGAMRIYNPVYDTDLSTLIHSGTGTGFHAINSKIHFPTEGSDLGKEVFAFSRCDQGIWLQNSVVDGGNQKSGSVTLAGTGASSLAVVTVYQNVLDGVRVDNSLVDLQACWMVYSNGRSGFNSNGSVLKFSQYLVTHNFDVGIKLKSSELIYGTAESYPLYGGNEEFISEVQFGPAGTIPITQFHCTHNNLNIHLVESSFTPVRKAGEVTLPLKFGSMNGIYSWSYGSTADGVGPNRPSMILDNSYGEFIHFFGATLAGDGVNPGVIKGAICQARNGSTAKFIGTRKSNTQAIGTASEGSQTAGFHGTASNLQYFQRMAAFAALDNSKIEFCGPTRIYHFGVGALAEDNSIIRFGPQKQGDHIESEAWELSAAGNHTKVDLHSTRAGLVAKDNSRIILEYMGDGDFAPHGGASDNFTDGLPYTDSSHVSGGYFQFYPNPYDEGMGAHTQFSLANNANGLYNRRIMFSSEQVSATYGGMCVRAVGGSEVSVDHVNFPMGIDAVHLSGGYYDLSTTCWWPFIWNIADQSRITARNVKVSGTETSSHGYYGPSGLWATDGVELDWYGAYGPRQVQNGDDASHQNFGPFRLYFSIDPKYRNYVTTGSMDNGMLIHSMTQGYMPSGLTLSAIGGDGCTYRFNNEVSSAGAFTITSATVSSVLGAQGYLRNFMDESALNAWANSRHCTEDHIRMISVIKGAVDPEGEGSEHTTGHGVGIRSLNVFDLERKN